MILKYGEASALEPMILHPCLLNGSNHPDPRESPTTRDPKIPRLEISQTGSGMPEAENGDDQLSISNLPAESSYLLTPQEEKEADEQFKACQSVDLNTFKVPLICHFIVMLKYEGRQYLDVPQNQYTNLMEVLAARGCQVKLHNIQTTVKDMKQILQEVANTDYRDCGGVLLVISTHGYHEDDLVLEDGYIFTKDIMVSLLEIRHLKYKVKMLFIEACRGKRPGTKVKETKLLSTDKDFSALQKAIQCSPSELILYFSTVQDTVSFSTDEGCPYEMGLTFAINTKYDGSCDLETCLRYAIAHTLSVSNRCTPEIISYCSRSYLWRDLRTPESLLSSLQRALEEPPKYQLVSGVGQGIGMIALHKKQAKKSPDIRTLFNDTREYISRDLLVQLFEVGFNSYEELASPINKVISQAGRRLYILWLFTQQGESIEKMGSKIRNFCGDKQTHAHHPKLIVLVQPDPPYYFKVEGKNPLLAQSFSQNVVISSRGEIHTRVSDTLILHVRGKVPCALLLEGLRDGNTSGVDVCALVKQINHRLQKEEKMQGPGIISSSTLQKTLILKKIGYITYLTSQCTDGAVIGVKNLREGLKFIT